MQLDKCTLPYASNIRVYVTNETRLALILNPCLKL